jgi:benzoyl-CoA 2,3-epoxidase subunit B
MLTEEAHHMFVGETGIGRIIERTIELMKQNPNGDARGGRHRSPTMQKYINFWYSVSIDLFGGEISSNAANYFASSLKGRAKEEKYEDHVALRAPSASTCPSSREGCSRSCATKTCPCATR